MSLHLPNSCAFALKRLSDGACSVRDISFAAASGGLNRRHDDVDAWADLPLRLLSDIGLVEQTAEPGVYKITASGRKVAGQ